MGAASLFSRGTIRAATALHFSVIYPLQMSCVAFFLAAEGWRLDLCSACAQTRVEGAGRDRPQDPHARQRGEPVHGRAGSRADYAARLLRSARGGEKHSTIYNLQS